MQGVFWPRDQGSVHQTKYFAPCQAPWLLHSLPIDGSVPDCLCQWPGVQGILVFALFPTLILPLLTEALGVLCPKEEQAFSYPPTQLGSEGLPSGSPRASGTSVTYVLYYRITSVWEQGLGQVHRL